MRFTPWQLLAVMVAGAMSQHDREVINYLREENRVLREKLGPKRVLLASIISAVSPASGTAGNR